jgi:predicted hydrocarbon binding protein
MGLERAAGLGELIDEVWSRFLDELKKKEIPKIRATFGDEVNLFVPQVRMLLPLHANPRFPISLYTSSYLGARRNAYAIMRKLDMPPDFFWKFEYWTNERAFEVLSKVVNRIFREILKSTKEGLLSVENASTDPKEIKILLALEECVECVGVTANHPLCYYHAGTITGIISALLGKELDCYETSCCATGGSKCEFMVVNKGRGEELEKYLNPATIDFALNKRLEGALGGQTLRSIGNEANLRYYHLVILNSLITNPKLFSASSYELGKDYGKNLVAFLAQYYQKQQERELFEVVSQYYRFLRQLRLEFTQGATVIRAAEVAEISGMAKSEDFLGFLLGELEGIVSVLRNEPLRCTEPVFEGNDLILKLTQQ